MVLWSFEGFMLLLFILTDVPDEDESVIDPASEDGGRRFSSEFRAG